MQRASETLNSKITHFAIHNITHLSSALSKNKIGIQDLLPHLAIMYARLTIQQAAQGFLHSYITYQTGRGSDVDEHQGTK